MFDFQAGAELATPSSPIIHDELRPLPSAIEIEESLPLTAVENLAAFEQSKLHKASIRRVPLTKHCAAELQGL